MPADKHPSKWRSQECTSIHNLDETTHACYKVWHIICKKLEIQLELVSWFIYDIVARSCVVMSFYISQAHWHKGRRGCPGQCVLGPRKGEPSITFTECAWRSCNTTGWGNTTITRVSCINSVHQTTQWRTQIHSDILTQRIMCNSNSVQLNANFIYSQIGFTSDLQHRMPQLSFSTCKVDNWVPTQ